MVVGVYLLGRAASHPVCYLLSPHRFLLVESLPFFLLECGSHAIFVSDRGMPGLSVALTPVQEDWRPTLQRLAVSEGGSRVAATKPLLPGVTPPRGGCW